MAGQHLKDLLSAYGARDDLLFRRAAQAIITEEEAKKHTVLARDLSRILAVNSSVGLYEEPAVAEPPMDRDSSTPLALVSFPERYFGALTLAPAVAKVMNDYVHEVQRWPELDAAGLPRRNRVLLHGPAGCGKTSTVQALATSLGRPLVTARVDGLVSSYLGETASNLSKLFEYANSGSFVLLLDEFDSLGKMRDDPSDHGELRRVVNAVLQMIDSYAGPSIIVAATNHAQVLDSALWRRFDLVAELPLPTEEELQQVLFSVLRGRADVYDLERFAHRLAGLPHAAAEFGAHSALRRAILAGRTQALSEDLDDAITEVSSRRWI